MKAGIKKRAMVAMAQRENAVQIQREVRQSVFRPLSWGVDGEDVLIDGSTDCSNDS
jgi:hypothetical protein